MKADAVVIGAGIHGCSVALHLARSGIVPVVFEQSHPGRHASGVNAGGLRQLNRHPAEIPLSVVAADMWRHIGELVDSDCDTRFPGQVRVAENQAELESLEARASLDIDRTEVSAEFDAPPTLARWREEGDRRTLYLLDVRQPKEYQEGHLR